MNIEIWKQKKKELHLTHDELALKSGISRRTIAGIFSGDPTYSSPTMNTVQAIERALGLGAPTHPSNGMLTEDEKRLLSAYSALIPSMQKYVLQMVEALVSQTQNKVK